MLNYWLNKRFKVGKRVRYIGTDINLNGKIGKIVRVHDNWLDVEFEIFAYLTVMVREFSVEKENLELV